MKKLNKNLCAISFLLTGSLFAEGTSNIQALLETSHIVFVPKSAQSATTEQAAKIMDAKPIASIQTNATPNQQSEAEPKEQKFSFMAGLKKGVNYMVSPIVAHPWISALAATLGLGYAYKQGYLNQLLVKLGLEKNDDAEIAVVPVVNE